MDGGRPNQRQRCETSPTPGAAPRRDGTRTKRRRAIPTEREPLPTRVTDTSPLPTAYDVVVDEGLHALGLDLAPAERTAIDGHIRLLLAWTEAINLTAVREPRAAATAHVLDALAAVPTLRALGIDRFLDLGSGGGVPGIPVAVALPAATAMLVEPIGKKARFLETAVEAVGLGERVAVAPVRAEALAQRTDHRGRWLAVTARAVAPTAELVELAFPLLARDGVLVAWKRGDLTTELAAARRAIDALGGGTIDVDAVSLPTLAGHVLVVIRRTGAVGPSFPRDPSVRKRRPW